MNPSDRQYTKEHEWLKIQDAESNLAIVGITDYAQEQLGDVVFIDMPEIGSNLVHMEKMGEIESVKAVSDLFSPVSGEVIKTNSELLDRPELINEDPYNEGWILQVILSDTGELSSLISADEYQSFTEQA
ncbi:MAG: glycine cleavage system protein GcvH [SAR202 cluster bacterium]|nr:MAG: glycine cleavage system protein GcvH [SAR202 cluster bacterium]MBH38856.1 glycine cleavage system protein H [Chloroflexota bacterium]GIS82095.1 MAG: glycine cleavage system H protein [Dehalococcoidia bacterium]